MLDWEPTAVTDDRDTWVGSTVKHFENMALNLEALLRYIENQNSVVAYYEECNGGD